MIVAGKSALLLCTAEPFGYGPSSSLAQILPHVAAPRGALEAVYVGEGHALDLLRRSDVLRGRVERCALSEPAGRDRFRERCRGAEALLCACDFEAARLAREAGTPVLLYDPLSWYWREIPEVCREAELYLCQDFFGVRERLAAEGFANAVVVPPLTPRFEATPGRSGALVSLGGLANPYFSLETCVEYAAAVLRAVERALAGRGRVSFLTSKAVAERVPGLEVATLSPDDVHRRMAGAEVVLLTPGLGQIYEAAALGPPAVWLPPANDSQGRQLALVRRHGMAPGAVDWHDFLDVEPVDYEDDQPRVMARLREHMERLGADAGARERLAACLERRLAAVLADAGRGPFGVPHASESQRARGAPGPGKPGCEREPTHGEGARPLAGLVARFGREGAEVAGRAVGGWLQNPRRRALPRPALELPDAAGRALPPFARQRDRAQSSCLRAEVRECPTLAPLRLPRGNWGDERAVEAMRRLHEEVDGTGFHTLAAPLELARDVRNRTETPAAADFAAARRAFARSGPELFARYGACHCTGLAEVLAARIQRETGLAGSILCVRYRDSKIPLDIAWEDYEGTVHADLLVPFADEATGAVRAVHIVTGMGVGNHFHVFDDMAALSAHLADLRYTFGAVVDPGELTRAAFGYKNRLWIVEGPEVGDGSAKLGADLIAGEVFLNGVASRSYAGPRPGGADAPRVACELAWATDPARAPLLRAFLEAAAAQFRQPEGFVEDMLFLAAHLDAYVDGLLCEPGRRLRRERRGGEGGRHGSP